MKTKTLNQDAKQISDALNECQTQLSDAVLNSVERQRSEVMGLVQDQYSTVKQKAQEFLEKGAQAQEKLGKQASAYNSKLEVAAKKMPRQVTRTVVNNPWLALAVALALGAAVGFWLKPSPQAE